MSDKQLSIIDAPQLPERMTVLEVFAGLARDLSIPLERIKGLMDMQEQAERRDAEKQFIAAFSRMKFPPIKKTSKAHNSKYASFDDIQEIINPILDREGFTLTFTSGDVTPQGIPIHGLLSHVAGHSRGAVLYLPRDKSGSMNEIQGTGSTTSYGQRYVAKMMLNLRFIGDDDDADSISAISEDQVRNIECLMDECKLSPTARSKFMEMMGCKVLSDIQQGAYKVAINFLVAKRRAVEEAK